MVRIAGADCADLRLRALLSQLSHAAGHHGAVMLAMAAAAGGESGIRILSEGQRGSDGRKTDGREQDEAEEAREHEWTGSVYAFACLGDKASARYSQQIRWNVFLVKNVRELRKFALS